MFSRAVKEIVGDKKLFLYGMIIVIGMLFGITVLQMKVYTIKGCFMDAYVWSSKALLWTVYIVVPILTILFNKENFNINAVVRYDKMRKVWMYTFIKTGIISFIYAVVSVLSATLCGALTTDKICDWDNKKSLFYCMTGITMSHTNLTGIIVVYFVGCFLGLYVVNIFAMFIIWYFNNYAAAVISVVAVCIIGVNCKLEYYGYRTLFYDNIIEGIDLRYHIYYPIVLILFFYVIGDAKTKREFLR